MHVHKNVRVSFVSGGLHTVLYTDAIQVVIMIVGSVVLAIIGECVCVLKVSISVIHLCMCVRTEPFVVAFVRVGGMAAMEEKYMTAVPDSYWISNATGSSCGLPRSDALHIFRYFRWTF